MKKAVITGASSGIGKEMAFLLAERGYSLVLAARREELLKDVASKTDVPCEIAVTDLTDENAVYALFEENRDADILINNAGFGVFGEFTSTDYKKESEMIDVNIKALHLLTKLYLTEFKKRGSGKILNVASSASFFPGPLFSSYYASKAYVLRLSRAIGEELRREKSKITISVLCPGPVDTEFNDVANVKFSIGALSAKEVANIGIKGMMRGKRVIVPGFGIKCTRLLSKIVPDFIAEKIVYRIQKSKGE